MYAEDQTIGDIPEECLQILIRNHIHCNAPWLEDADNQFLNNSGHHHDIMRHYKIAMSMKLVSQDSEITMSRPLIKYCCISSMQCQHISPLVFPLANPCFSSIKWYLHGLVRIYNVKILT